jgi:hypothetical protein
MKPYLGPTTQAFIDKLAAAEGPALYELSYKEAREVLKGAAGHQPKVAAQVEDQTWNVGPTGQLDIRIVRPEGATSVLPVVLYCHGGGWLMGNKDTHEPLVRKIAAGANVAVVFVNYTPAPDAQYPVQNEQAYDALDDKGFVLTANDLVLRDRWHLERPPFFLETSCPGVFAVGDVRSGSVKRVASAIGEGSIAIVLAHQYMSLS